MNRIDPETGFAIGMTGDGKTATGLGLVLERFLDEAEAAGIDVPALIETWKSEPDFVAFVTEAPVVLMVDEVREAAAADPEFIAQMMAAVRAGRNPGLRVSTEREL